MRHLTGRILAASVGGLNIHYFVEVGTLCALHHWTGSLGARTESLRRILLLNNGVVLAELGEAAGLGLTTRVLHLVRLDRLVVDAPFMLRHQDIVLLSLLLRLYLLVQRVNVLLLRLFFLHLLLLFENVDGLDSLSDLVRVDGIALTR